MSDDETRVVVRPDPDDPHQRLVGSILAGRYRILELLGVGAMGAVYLGEHLKIGRRDAIKVLHGSMARDPGAIARFDRGARNVGAIRHPNVCTIYDFSDTDEGVQYLAMEYVEGESLKDLIDRDGRLPLDRALGIAEQIGAALQAAHDVGVVHRDLKPGNIMIARRPDGSDAVKVVDFDISKGSREVVQEEVTQLGFVIGTPEYMSPEQVAGGALDGRSDVYSMALVVYAMLTGALPLRGSTVRDTMAARLRDAPPERLGDLAPGAEFPEALQEALDEALRGRPEDRTPRAADLAARLRQVRLEGPARPAATVVPVTGGAKVEALPGTRGREAEALPGTRGGEAAGPPPTRAAASKGLARFRRPRVWAGAAAGVALIVVSGFAAERAGLLSGAEADRPPAGEERETATQPLREAAADDGATGDAGRDPSSAEPAQGDGSASPEDGAPPPLPASEPADSVRTQAAGPDRPEPSAGGLASRAEAILTAQRERLARSPAPTAAALRAMGDTAQTLFDLGGVSAADRGTAAFVAASVALYLGDFDGCARWADRAVGITPDNPGYVRILETCRAGARSGSPD